MNTKTDRTALLSFDGPGDVRRWIIDHQGVPRIAHSYSKGTHMLWYRESEKSRWTKIDEGNDTGLHITPLAFDFDDKTLYVAARRDDKEAIRIYDAQSKTPGEWVAASRETDIHTLIFNRQKRKLLGASYEADTPGVVWFEADMAKLQHAVDAALPNTYNELQVAEENPRRALVRAYSDVDPGTAYLLDTEKLTLEELFKLRPWIDPHKMWPRTAVRYTARDGLEIPAYLTVPKRADGRRPPLVVIIHGGPWVRGSVWGFKTEVQFFASRGYAVLEPEFRGSDGHGWKLLSAVSAVVLPSVSSS